MASIILKNTNRMNKAHYPHYPHYYTSKVL